MGLEVELASIHYHSAQRTAVAAYELRGAVYHHIHTMLEGTYKDGCEGVIYNEEYAVTVCHLGNGIQVGHIAVGVAEGLGVDDLGVGTYCGLQCLQVVYVHDAVFHALGGQRVGDEIEGAAVEVVGCHDVITILKHVLQCIGDGCSTACHGQTCHSALQRSHSSLKHILGAVGQSAVDVAGITQSEAVGSMLGVVENIAGSLIDRHCASVACGVGGLLTNMKCQSLKVQFLICCHSRILFICLYYPVLCVCYTWQKALLLLCFALQSYGDAGLSGNKKHLLKNIILKRHGL